MNFWGVSLSVYGKLKHPYVDFDNVCTLKYNIHNTTIQNVVFGNK